MAFRSRVGKAFVFESVLGFGFISGVWVCVGIDPETRLAGVFAGLVDKFAPGSGLDVVFWLIPTFLMIASLIAAYFSGGFLGLVAVGCAFMGGCLITTKAGIALLVIGILLGFIAPWSKKKVFSKV